jgi:hypothetical protein
MEYAKFTPLPKTDEEITENERFCIFGEFFRSQIKKLHRHGFIVLKLNKINNNHHIWVYND